MSITCRKCGASYGCGCQLKNGLCPACVKKEQEQIKQNASPKTY
jgi:NMD protein affecting ribosome stability and mRNA decay